MRSKLSQRGFTVMEILVAFVVLGAAVGILYRTFSTGLNNVEVVSGYSEAIAVADAKLAGLGLEQPLQEGEESGTTEDRRFNWKVTVLPFTPPGTPPEQLGTVIIANQLLRASVTVTWNERRDQKRTIELSTVRMVTKSPI